MLGTTVLYSSGDDGVAGGGGVCLNAKRRRSSFDPQHVTDAVFLDQPVENGTVFSPGFPVRTQ